MTKSRPFNNVLSRSVRGGGPIMRLLKSGFLVITDVITPYEGFFVFHYHIFKNVLKHFLWVTKTVSIFNFFFVTDASLIWWRAVFEDGWLRLGRSGNLGRFGWTEWRCRRNALWFIPICIRWPGPIETTRSWYDGVQCKNKNAQKGTQCDIRY